MNTTTIAPTIQIISDAHGSYVVIHHPHSKATAYLVLSTVAGASLVENDDALPEPIDVGALAYILSDWFMERQDGPISGFRVPVQLVPLRYVYGASIGHPAGGQGLTLNSQGALSQVPEDGSPQPLDWAGVLAILIDWFKGD